MRTFGRLRTSEFLSTLPARGATCAALLNLLINCNFYPRSPRGERLGILQRDVGILGISIHAPREGSDWANTTVIAQLLDFYPRSPRGERLALCLSVPHGHNISIHAPREGSDLRWSMLSPLKF